MIPQDVPNFQIYIRQIIEDLMRDPAVSWKVEVKTTEYEENGSLCYKPTGVITLSITGTPTPFPSNAFKC